ncbi:hypothetical protein IMY05_004G0083700 [Salix suchowensis]|nr:hypothetical protein IMY05_004G0083700 [Salix suchowensis]
MCLSAPAVGPNVMAHMRWLPHRMEIHVDKGKLTYVWVKCKLPGNQMVSILLTITLSNMDAAATYDGDETQEKLIRITVIQAVLSAEKIQDLVPLGANGILILGQADHLAFSLITMVFLVLVLLKS